MRELKIVLKDFQTEIESSAALYRFFAASSKLVFVLPTNTFPESPWQLPYLETENRRGYLVIHVGVKSETGVGTLDLNYHSLQAGNMMS